MAPAGVPDALEALGAESSVVLAGGTSIGLLLGQALIEPSTLVWLGRIPSLREVAVEDDRIRIGATVTVRELARHPVVRSRLPAVATAAGSVGNPRIRAVATVGGALGHADPRQDLPPALAASGATVEIAGPGGTRRVDVARLATGLMETVVAPDELITGVDIPLPEAARGVYLRFTPASAADWPTVSAAAVSRRGPDGIVTDVSLALGGVGPTVLTVPEAGELKGSVAPSEEDIRAVADAAGRRCDPVADRLGSAAYKRAMAAVWARRALQACLEGAGRS